MPEPLRAHIFPHPRKEGFIAVVYTGQFGTEHQTLATGFESTRAEVEAWAQLTMDLCIKIHPALRAPDMTDRRIIEIVDA